MEWKNKGTGNQKGLGLNLTAASLKRLSFSGLACENSEAPIINEYVPSHENKLGDYFTV